MDTVTQVMEEAVKKVEKNAKALRLEKLGFKALGGQLKELNEAKRKMAVAYEHFRYVTQEKIDDFNRKLREESKTDGGRAWKELSFSRIEDYDKCPPDDVLVKLEDAQKVNCFDYYEVAYIRQVKDPIIFGRITKCTDRFFIGQWDDDITIDMLLKANEG